MSISFLVLFIHLPVVYMHVFFVLFFIMYESYCHITSAAQTLPVRPFPCAYTGSRCIQMRHCWLPEPSLFFCCAGCESLWVSELFSAEQKPTGKAICAVFSLTACGRTVRGKRQERAAVRSGRTETGIKTTQTLPPARKKTGRRKGSSGKKKKKRKATEQPPLFDQHVHVLVCVDSLVCVRAGPRCSQRVRCKMRVDRRGHVHGPA